VFTVAIPIHNSSFRTRRGSEVLSLHADSSGDDHIPPGGSPGGNGKPLLLVVDDNDDFREFVTALFEESYKVITAADGREACDKVLEDLPDLIIADVMMPGMDGYEFCRTVKGDIRTSHIPVVLLTARSSEESKYSGIEAGADDYIAKPFDIDMLRLRISKIIERQKKLYEGFRKRIDISPGEVAVTSMDEKFVRRAVSIVEENIERADFLVEDLCAELGISRVYFYKKILALTDKTPSEFIRFIRIKRAAALIEKSQMFVNEVAYKVGFNDPKYFRNYFKKEFGVTPSEYKKQFEERS
jgi:DNA-binding response OmpR family regulator